MVQIVGQETIEAKRDLLKFMPKEFTDRLLINQFVSYVMNNFYEKSSEKVVSGYIGELSSGDSKYDYYIDEPTVSRQISQLIPVIRSSTDTNGREYFTFQNFVSELKNEGCLTYDYNKLLSSPTWSWCPPINVDMFINFSQYFWFGGSTYEMGNLGKILNEKNSSLNKTEKEMLKEELKTIGTKYPYLYSEDSSVYQLEIPSEQCVVVLDKVNEEGETIETDWTTAVLDIIGQKTYSLKCNYGHYAEKFNDSGDTIITFALYENTELELKNGMRIMFRRDNNENLAEEVYIVSGVGESIELISDNINQYFSFDTPQYFIMERGCKDGNLWSYGNRWVHRDALKEIDASYTKHFIQAKRPIICFIKDIELYNHGTFDRGYVDVATNLSVTEINKLNSKSLDGVKLFNGMRVLILKNEDGVNSHNLYRVTVLNGTAILQPIYNGQKDDGFSYDGDCYRVYNGSYKGKTFYYKNFKFVEGQTKEDNVSPLFNLYDVDKYYLGDYENTEFKGNKLFDYKQTTEVSAVTDPYLNKKIIVDDNNNYQFVNHINSDSIYYTPYQKDKQEIVGYKFYKIVGEDRYLNDWHYNDVNNELYIKTQIKVSYVDPYTTFTTLELDYEPDVDSDKKTVILYCNGAIVDESRYDVSKNGIMVAGLEIDDVIDIYFLKSDLTDDLIDGYEFELPPSLKLNQLNEDIDTIGYNNCLDQMMSILENQQGFEGTSYGVNNYYNISNNLSLGEKILQHSEPIIRSIIVNSSDNTSIRNSIAYVANQYNVFVSKFRKVSDEMILNQEYTITLDDIRVKSSVADTYIKQILNKINIGKEGLMPFYNNGVAQVLGECYIPASPSYLGMELLYKPKEFDYTDTLDGSSFKAILCHNGAVIASNNTITDLVQLRLEELIYESANDKFKDNKPDFNSLKILPGRFRNTKYNRNEVLKLYSSLLEDWANTNGLDYTKNINFDYSLDNPNSWKTWNYTNCVAENGEELNGSYKSVYLYYYDTYRPHTSPWEMLGFGDKPSWWEKEYGKAPYTSNNTILWNDIEQGIIRQGECKGQYDELKREGLIEKFLPVDSQGNLKSPLEIGIINNIPLVMNAKKNWVVGDIGEVENAYMQTNQYRFDKQLLLYLLRPVEWIETNWDALNHRKLFNGSDLQIISGNTLKRESLADMVIHNELVDDSYVRNIGLQQWVSDYLTSQVINITDYLGTKIRNADVSLGYRCAGYYQGSALTLDTDTYGEIPADNIYLKVFKSYTGDVLTYSGIVFEKTDKGYVAQGYDSTQPWFTMKEPEIYGERIGITYNNRTVYHYKKWKNTTKRIAYGHLFTSLQDVYTFIEGYGKYLEDQGFVFNTLTPSGEILDFNKSAETFMNWATSLADSNRETNGNVLLVNPGVLGVGLYHRGVIDDVTSTINGKPSMLNIYNNEIKKENISVLRSPFASRISVENENIAMLKVRLYEIEHLLVVDNETIFGDVLYEPLLANIINRIKVRGIKSGKWYGTLYAPGFLVKDGGAIPNYDKNADDLNDIFDTDSSKCKGEYEKLSKYTVGYVEKKYMNELFKNDQSEFDFYKGSIREKGTLKVLNKLNRSSVVSAGGTPVTLYEKWAFKEGEYGHTRDNSTQEFLLDQNKIIRNPQVITYTTAVNNYYDETKQYHKGDKVVYYNTEYKCKDLTSTVGRFKASEWEELRTVSSYIIHWDDEKWLKRNSLKLNNHFNFAKTYKTNPMGGFAMTSDVDYIVANEEAFDEIKDGMALTQKVWIVKLSNGNWDVRKKTGKNKFVSMRYNNIEDAYNQQEFDFVYEVSDNNETYYTNRNSKTIDDETSLYKDIDLEEYACKWKNLLKPEYKGDMGSYVESKLYKIKLMNTIFTTTTPQQSLTLSTPVTATDGQHYTYSNLMMSYNPLDEDFIKHRCLFTIKVDTKVDLFTITINGVKYTKRSRNDNTIRILCMEYDTINWKVEADKCITVSDTCNFYHNSDVVDVTVNVQLKYKPGAILTYNTKAVNNLKVPMEYAGYYQIVMQGAGGGGGGAYTYRVKKKKWYKKFTSSLVATILTVGAILTGVGAVYLAVGMASMIASGVAAGLLTAGYVVGSMRSSGRTRYLIGSGGGSGGYIDYRFKIDTAHEGVYSLSVGLKGAGGALSSGAGKNGTSGGDTILYGPNQLIYAVASGGAGGRGYGNGSNLSETIYVENGGLIYPNPYSTRVPSSGGNAYINQYIKENEVSDEYHKNYAEAGMTATTSAGGYSLFLETNKCGMGGSSTFSNGEAGNDGLVKITFIDYFTKAESTDLVSYTYTSNDSTIDINGTEHDYTKVKQLFINDGEEYYTLGVDKEYDERPNASIINDSTLFYKYRSRKVVAKAKPNVGINPFSQVMTYNIGDIFSYSTDNMNTYTQYITTVSFTGDEVASGSKQLSDVADLYNIEGYYKITSSDENAIDATKHSEYLMYYDVDCKNPIYTSHGTDNKYVQMKVTDLQLSGNNYVFEDIINLVDEMGSYYELKPLYISDASMGNMNVVGSYPVYSGNGEYYTYKAEGVITDSDVLFNETDCKTKVVQAKTEISEITIWNYEDTYYCTQSFNPSTSDLVYQIVDGDILTTNYVVTTVNSSLLNDESSRVDSVVINDKTFDRYSFDDNVNAEYGLAIRKKDNTVYYAYANESDTKTRYTNGDAYTLTDETENGVRTFKFEKVTSKPAYNETDVVSLYMCYGDVSTTSLDKYGVSYKLIEGETEYWTNVPPSNLEDDDLLYSDEGLTEEVGTYLSYIPNWKTKSFVANPFINRNMLYPKLDGDSIYTFTGTNTGGVDVYTYTPKDLYYISDNYYCWSNDNGSLFTPSNSEIIADISKVYTKKYVWMNGLDVYYTDEIYPSITSKVYVLSKTSENVSMLVDIGTYEELNANENTGVIKFYDKSRADLPISYKTENYIWLNGLVVSSISGDTIVVNGETYVKNDINYEKFIPSKYFFDGVSRLSNITPYYAWCSTNSVIFTSVESFENNINYFIGTEEGEIFTKTTQTITPSMLNLEEQTITIDGVVYLRDRTKDVIYSYMFIDGGTGKSSIKLFEKQGDNYVEYTNDINNRVRLKSLDGIYFADDEYNDLLLDSISTISSDKTSGTMSNQVKLFFNEQAVGKSIMNQGIIFETSKTADLSFVFNPIEEDPVYNIFNTVIRNIHMTSDMSSDEWLNRLDDETMNLETSNSYINEDEIRNRIIENVIIGKQQFMTHQNIHTCLVCEMYIGDGKESKYVELYKLDDKFYMNASTIFDDVDLDLAVYIGTAEEITSYVADCYKLNRVDEDEIVNVINYKEKDDLIYITKDSYVNRNLIDDEEYAIVSDEENISTTDGAKSSKSENAWMKLEFIDRNYQFNLSAIETKRINVDNIKSCYLVNNTDDSTITTVSIFDPIQGIIPNNVLDEISYITTFDPVGDYDNIASSWYEPKLGHLWWDISKVRYIDYYQGDDDYRSSNWGKQLPGSEIVINEWVSSVDKPTDDRKYITKKYYNSATDTVETKYFYWEKNPSELPNISFRNNSALAISMVINDPTEAGIVWASPIRCQEIGNQENSIVIANTVTVASGQPCVLQINSDSDNEVDDHCDWRFVKDNSDDEIPDFLWEKMRDSLLGYRETEIGDIIVPDPTLLGRNMYGIGFRPRQTMFKDRYMAKMNFIDCANNIFANRNIQEAMDVRSSLVDEIDLPDESQYEISLVTFYQLKNWKDASYIGKDILIEHDETHNGIWVIYHLNSLTDFSIKDYQKYDISKFTKTVDWYANEEIDKMIPRYTISKLEDINYLDARVNDIIKFESKDGWVLYKITEKSGVIQKGNEGYYDYDIVGQENAILNIDSSIYDWETDVNVDDSTLFINYDNTKDYVFNKKYYKGDVVKVTHNEEVKYYKCSKTTYEFTSEVTVWTKSTNYNNGDVVMYNGMPYVCKTAHKSDTSFTMTEKSKWLSSWEEVKNITYKEYLNAESQHLIATLFDYFAK